ncbi:hypothetical protein V8E51_016325 [Hyaloscypha variabilis]
MKHAMLHSKACLGIALLVRSALATLNTNCFRMSNGEVTENIGAVPCGVVTANSPNVACCNAGNYCLEDYICMDSGTPATGFSGYYTGGCTDITYLDKTCNPYCRSLPRADIVYNNQTQLWSCCGTESDNSTVNCNDPTTQVFEDPAPTALTATFSVGSTAVTSAAASTSSSSIVTTSSSSSTSSATTSSGSPAQTGTGAAQPSSGLSTGAKAGIGVGVAIVGIAVLAGVIFALYRRRREETQPPGYDPKTAPAELGAVREVKRAEMGAGQPVLEMP